MIYVCFITYSYLFFKRLGNYKNINSSALIFYTIPFIIIWTLLIGGQYNVGTDYLNYHNIFSKEYFLYHYYAEGEYLFYYFIHGLWEIGILGQGVFFVISFIECSIFLYIAYLVVDRKRIYVFFLLFICFSTVFNNQMNGIRQYFAVYILTLASVFLVKKECVKFIVLSFVALGFHKSAILFLPVLLLLFFCRKITNSYILILFLVLAFGSNLFSISDILLSKMEYVPIYSYYGEKSYLEDLDFKDKILKFLYIPLYIYSILRLKKMQLSNVQLSLFVIGIYAYAIKLFCLNLTVLNRFGMYFEILMIFPLLFILSDIRKKYYLYLCLLGAIVFIYILKVTLFAIGEYSYQSVYFLS